MKLSSPTQVNHTLSFAEIEKHLNNGHLLHSNLRSSSVSKNPLNKIFVRICKVFGCYKAYRVEALAHAVLKKIDEMKMTNKDEVESAYRTITSLKIKIDRKGSHKHDDLFANAIAKLKTTSGCNSQKIDSSISHNVGLSAMLIPTNNSSLAAPGPKLTNVAASPLSASSLSTSDFSTSSLLASSTSTLSIPSLPTPPSFPKDDIDNLASRRKFCAVDIPKLDLDKLKEIDIFNERNDHHSALSPLQEPSTLHSPKISLHEQDSHPETNSKSPHTTIDTGAENSDLKFLIENGLRFLSNAQSEPSSPKVITQGEEATNLAPSWLHVPEYCVDSRDATRRLFGNSLREEKATNQYDEKLASSANTCKIKATRPAAQGILETTSIEVPIPFLERELSSSLPSRAATRLSPCSQKDSFLAMAMQTELPRSASPSSTESRNSSSPFQKNALHIALSEQTYPLLQISGSDSSRVSRSSTPLLEE